MAAASFDYVLVGGGTAGLALAARLIDDPTISVCVFEAGEDVTKELDLVVPGFAFKNLGQPRVDWGFTSMPQSHAKGRSLYLPRGKALGGTSMINLMTLGRGHEAEYDVLETLGSPDWGWKGLIDYFRMSETFAPTPQEMSDLQVEVNMPAHGTSGPLQRTLPKWVSDVHAPFIQAMKSLGVPYTLDGASGNNAGMWTSNHSIDSQGARSSSASVSACLINSEISTSYYKAYYEPRKLRPNLTVITGAQVTRILFNTYLDTSGNMVASSVAYDKDGELHTISASREILICAGTFKTPQLLELSGIGDKAVLAAQDIEVKVDLPGVGANLRELSVLLLIELTCASEDHFWSPFVTETDPKYESVEVLRDPARAAEERKTYEDSKSGMLSGTCSSLYAFLPKSHFMDNYEVAEETPTSLHPPLERIQKAWLSADEIPFLEISLFPGFLPIPGQNPETGKSYCSVFLALTHPFSSGSVHIASSDPLAAPAIDHRVLDNEIDLDILVRAVKFARKLCATPSLSAVVAREIIPGPAVQTDDEIKDFIRSTIDTVFHPIGTAAMLPREDRGVVDPSLKVYGTANVRVIDASIIPIQLSAHIQATVYAIAEKAGRSHHH
ncbi:alcohol oxidase [Mycena vitilis]|nr:alcohol oxidase [Mycena vitilis]